MDNFYRWKSSTQTSMYTYRQRPEEFLNKVYPKEQRQRNATKTQLAQKLQSCAKNDSIASALTTKPKPKQIKLCRSTLTKSDEEQIKSALDKLSDFQLNANISKSEWTSKDAEEKNKIISKEIEIARLSLTSNVADFDKHSIHCLSTDELGRFKKYAEMLGIMFPSSSANQLIDLKVGPVTIGILQPQQEQLRLNVTHDDSINIHDYIDIPFHDKNPLSIEEQRCVLGLIPEIVTRLPVAIRGLIQDKNPSDPIMKEARLQYLIHRNLKRALFIPDEYFSRETWQSELEDPLFSDYLRSSYKASQNERMSIYDNIMARLQLLQQGKTELPPSHLCIQQIQRKQCGDKQSDEDKTKCLQTALSLIYDDLFPAPLKTIMEESTCRDIETLRLIHLMMKHQRVLTRKGTTTSRRAGFDFETHIQPWLGKGKPSDEQINEFLDAMFKGQHLDESSRDINKQKLMAKYKAQLQLQRPLDDVQKAFQNQQKIYRAKLSSAAQHHPSTEDAVPQTSMFSLISQTSAKPVDPQRPSSIETIQLALEYLAEKARIIRQYSGSHRTRVFLSQQPSYYYTGLLETTQYTDYINKQTPANLAKLIKQLLEGSQLLKQERKHLGVETLTIKFQEEFLKLIQLSPNNIKKSIAEIKEQAKTLGATLGLYNGTWQQRVKKIKQTTKNPDHKKTIQMFF